MAAKQTTVNDFLTQKVDVFNGFSRTSVLVRMATTQIAFHPQAAVRWIFVTFHPFVMAAQKLFGHFAKNFKALKYWQTASNCCEMGAWKLDRNILFAKD